MRAAIDGAHSCHCGRCARRRAAFRAHSPSSREQLKVAIDLNAVPPVGIAGIKPQDKAVEQDGQICYGAIGVGGLKMKLHKAAIRRLFREQRRRARRGRDLRAGRGNLTTKDTKGTKKSFLTANGR